MARSLVAFGFCDVLVIAVGRMTSETLVAGDQFGASVVLQGDVAVLGAAESDSLGLDSGAAHVFRRLGPSWSEEARLLPSDGAPGDAIGTDVALWGDLALVGAPRANATGTESGAAYVFRRVGSAWQEEQKLVGSDTAGGDHFGATVSSAGDRDASPPRSRGHSEGGGARPHAWTDPGTSHTVQ